MGIGDPAVIAEFLGHVEDVVDLHDAEVRIEALEPRQIGQDVAAPADVTLAGAELPAAGGRAVAFVVGRDVVHAAMRPATEFPNAVGDLDRKTVVQVARHYEDFLTELLPFGDHAFALVEKAGP